MISLIIVNYNQKRYLEKAIRSILEQTRIDWQLLIWDDGSRDNSVEIAREYQQQDHRIKVIAAEHQGVAKARKQAIDATTGDYIGWIDSDDWVANTAIETTAKVLDNNSAIGMVYTDYYDVNSRGKILGLGKRCNIPYSPQRLLVDFMTFHFRLLRREVYEQIGGINPDFKYVYDYDLCLRLSETTEIAKVDQPLYYYRHHCKSRSAKYQKQRITWSEKAINQALIRRQLDSIYVLVVESDRFYLRKKEEKVLAQLWGEEIGKFTNLGELRGGQDSIFAPLALPQLWGEKAEKSPTPDKSPYRGTSIEPLHPSLSPHPLQLPPIGGNHTFLSTPLYLPTPFNFPLQGGNHTFLSFQERSKEVGDISRPSFQEGMREVERSKEVGDLGGVISSKPQQL